jgi:hypothetical protein
LPCSHGFCVDCLRRHVKAACGHAKLLPPKCCGITLNLPGDLETVLGKQIYELYSMKLAESRMSVKVYCRVSTCSALIVEENLKDDKAACQVCGALTCRRCLGKPHDGGWFWARRCRIDRVTETVLRMANNSGWKTCSNCKFWVERTAGCRHMS